jgi:replicative DNA helicase
VLATADARLGRAIARLREYEDSICLQRGSGRVHTVPAIERLADACAQRAGKPVVVFVDYLQKVPSGRDDASEADRVSRVAEGLKELALRRQTCVISNATLDSEGLRTPRLLLRNLAGSAALAYEADTVLMLAEKTDCVARVYFEFSPQKVEGFREWIVASLIKNRSGQNGIDLEFRKRFASASFDPIGGFVDEKLVDGRLYVQ